MNRKFKCAFIRAAHLHGSGPHHIRFMLQARIVIYRHAVRPQCRLDPVLVLLHYMPGFVGQVLFLTRPNVDILALCIRQGLHLGALPFGYESCWQESKGERKLACEPEHPGGVHVHAEEGPAVGDLFTRYASGMVTLATLASWLNEQGFRTSPPKRPRSGGPP